MRRLDVATGRRASHDLIRDAGRPIKERCRALARMRRLDVATGRRASHDLIRDARRPTRPKGVSRLDTRRPGPLAAAPEAALVNRRKTSATLSANARIQPR